MRTEVPLPTAMTSTIPLQKTTQRPLQEFLQQQTQERTEFYNTISNKSLLPLPYSMSKYEKEYPQTEKAQTTEPERTETETTEPTEEEKKRIEVAQLQEKRHAWYQLEKGKVKSKAQFITINVPALNIPLTKEVCYLFDTH